MNEHCLSTVMHLIWNFKLQLDYLGNSTKNMTLTFTAAKIIIYKTFYERILKSFPSKHPQHLSCSAQYDLNCVAPPLFLLPYRQKEQTQTKMPYSNHSKNKNKNQVNQDHVQTYEVNAS